MEKTTQELIPQITALLGEILKIPAEQIKADTSLTEELDIDSLTIVRLDLLIQARLGIALSADHLENIDSVQDLAEALIKHGQPVDKEDG